MSNVIDFLMQHLWVIILVFGLVILGWQQYKKNNVPTKTPTPTSSASPVKDPTTTSTTTTKTKKAGKGFWYYFWKFFWSIFAFMLFLLLAVKAINAIKPSFVEKNESKNMVIVDSTIYVGQTPCYDVPLKTGVSLYSSGPVNIMYMGVSKLEKVYYLGNLSRRLDMPNRRSTWVTITSTDSKIRDVVISVKVWRIKK